MSEHFIWDANAPSTSFKDGKGAWVPAHLYQRANPTSKMIVIGDIQPYQSVIDGSVIGGRKQHRDHLKAHGCIEVGNEKFHGHKEVTAGRVGPDVKRALQQLGID